MAFSNYSTTFGGTNEFLNMGNVLNFERTDTFSFSYWFKTTTSVQYILSKMNATPQGYGSSIDGGYIKFLLINNSPANSLEVRTAKTYIDNRWHHVVWAYDGSSLVAGVSCFIDGEDVTSTLVTLVNTLAATIVTAFNFNVGCRTSGTLPYTGLMDEIAIYDKELSIAEAQWIYNGGIPNDLLDVAAPSNLVAWWRMGDGDAHPTITDHSGNGYDGTMTNMEYTDFTGDVPPNYRKLPYPRYSWNFSASGSSEDANLGDVLAFERTEAFSFSLWFKTLQTSPPSGVIPLISKWKNTAANGYNFWGTTTGIVLSLGNNWGAANRLQTSTSTACAMTDGRWHHVVGTYDGSSTAGGIYLYHDGVSIARSFDYNTLSSTIVNTEPLRFAHWIDGASNYFYEGMLDEISIYTKALSEAEAQWIYNSGEPRDLLGTGAPSNLKAWWRMGDNDSLTVIRDELNIYNGTLNNMDADDLRGDAPSRNVSELITSSDFISGGEIVQYIMMARDSGTSPAQYTTWVTTDPTSSPTVLPIGAWVDKTILFKDPPNI